jgi:hypothetical protein
MFSNGTLGSVLRAVAVAASMALFVGAGVLDRPRTATGRTMHGVASRHKKTGKHPFLGKLHVRHVLPERTSGWSRRELAHPAKPSPLSRQLSNLEQQAGLHPEKVVRALAP